MNARPIIVAGFPRSGTTMLQLMLHAHPRIAIPPENRFVLTGYQRRHSFGDLREPAARRALARWILKQRHTRDLELDAEQVAAEIEAGPPTIGSAFGIVLRAYARRHGKPRWGDKRPAYLHHLHIITALFPNAQIVNIVRDGRDSIASLLEMPWNHRDIYRAIADWNTGVDIAQRAARTLGPSTFYQLRYEDLVADPAAELKALCDFLDEPFDPAMTEPAALASTAVPRHKTWHARTHQQVNAERVSSYRHRLEPWQLELCEYAMASRLRRHGYALTGAATPALPHRLRLAQVSTRAAVGRRARAAQAAFRRLLPSPSVACDID